MADDCPDPVENLKDAIDKVEEAYVTSQIDALQSIGDDLIDASNNPPPGTPDVQLQALCASIGAAADGFNDLRASCTFDPTGCLKEVADSGIFGDNPALRGAALAGAAFVDAVTGNFTPPFRVAPPSASIGITPSERLNPLPDSINLPDIPAPPPNPDCPDPIQQLNEALDSAEKTYLELHQKAADSIGKGINEITGGLGGLPTSAQADIACLSAAAGADAMASLGVSCSIDVGECIKQVLESGILGGAGALAAAPAAFGGAAATQSFVSGLS
jgi:hypothetical protein